MKKLIIIVTFCLLILASIVWLYRSKPYTVTADFGGRMGGVPFPAMYFGVGAVGSTLSNTDGIKAITDIHLLGNRMFVQVNEIYGNTADPSIPWWTGIDGKLERATRDGLSPIIVIHGTPYWLGSKPCSMPSDLTKMAEVVGSVVRHIDSKYPGLNYEVWNEPDANASFCPDPNLSNNGQVQFRDMYLQLYAAIAPEIRKASPTGHVGGPVLAAPGPNAATWLPAFLSGKTAPYVDFVSWHLYISGSWDLEHHMDWKYLYDLSQGSQGLTYYASMVSALVRKGSQPNPSQTPIYMTEYNVNHVFETNCCQNDSVYGPLWNAVAMDDLLNLPQPFSRIVYYAAANAAGYFCMLGKDGTDCEHSGDEVAGKRFPQFAYYEMLTSPSYLNLEQGFHVVTKPILPKELLATAIYNDHEDIILIVNPTDKNYPVSVAMTNTGLQNMQGIQDTLEQGALITQPQTVLLKNGQPILNAKIPPYSIVSVALTSH